MSIPSQLCASVLKEMKRPLALAAAVLALAISASTASSEPLFAELYQKDVGIDPCKGCNWNIDGTYGSVLKVGGNEMCPSEVVVKGSTSVGTNLAFVPFSHIQEDGVACEGKGLMLSYAMRGLLTKRGLNNADKENGIRHLLEGNKNASSQLWSPKKFKQSRLSFDRFEDDKDPVRRCGIKSYGKSSFYFNIKGGVGNKLKIGASREDLTTYTFDEGQNGIFIVAYDADKKLTMCVLRTSFTTAKLYRKASAGASVPPPTVSMAKEAGHLKGGMTATPSATKPSTIDLSVTAGLLMAAPVSANNKTDDAARNVKNERSAVDAACFPGSATVELEDGRVKRMQDLVVGDRVLASVGVYSHVFGFTHKLPRSQNSSEFVRLCIGENNSHLLLTSNHYIYLNGELQTSSSAQIGDILSLGDGRFAAVTSVGREMDFGLYNPQTLHGDIVVNGIVASTYTRAIDARIAHTALAAVRAAFSWFGAYTTSFEGGSEMTAILPHGAATVA